MKRQEPWAPLAVAMAVSPFRARLTISSSWQFQRLQDLSGRPLNPSYYLKEQLLDPRAPFVLISVTWCGE
jgi:hypothetical protein